MLSFFSSGAAPIPFSDMLDKLLQDPRMLPDVFDAIRDGLIVVDTGGVVRFFNRAAEEITGYRRDEVIGRPCAVFACDQCVVPGGPQGGAAAVNQRCTLRARDGRVVHVLKNTVPLRDERGEVIGTVESMTDITPLYEKDLELQGLKEELRQDYWFMGLLGKSVPMQRLYEHVRNAAQSEAPVLIVGESGSGKNLVAQAVHKLSRRREGPFVQMNCASLSEHLLESELFGHKKGSFTGAIADRIGRFEAAHEGSIFLDEIGDMPMTMQVKLLKVIEEKVVERVGEHKPISVNIRLLSATNKDVNSLVHAGTFREDLLYRINSIIIKVPPLRERRDDIPLIALHYLRKISSVNSKDIRSISPAAMEVLMDFPWPGNVRRLINALEHSAATCKGDVIEITDLPDYLVHERAVEAADGRVDLDAIRSALALFKGNRTLAARHLGVSRVTLWKRMKTFGIDA